MCTGVIIYKGRLGSCSHIENANVFFYHWKGSFKLICSWGNKIFIFNSPRPMDGCPLLKHYVWNKRRALSRASCSISVSSMDDVLTSTKNNSQKRKLISSDISEPSTVSKKRKVAQGCHVCGESFFRNSLLLACTFKWLISRFLYFNICSIQ